MQCFTLLNVIQLQCFITLSDPGPIGSQTNRAISGGKRVKELSIFQLEIKRNAISIPFWIPNEYSLQGFEQAVC